MRKLMTLVATGLVFLGVLSPGVAAAKAGDVIRTGGCSVASDWKLKLSPDDPAAIEVAFEVDENVVGHTWRVAVRHNGALVLRTRAVTAAPSGSFTIRAVVADAPGRDRVRARAVNLATGEVCFARAVLRG